MNDSPGTPYSEDASVPDDVVRILRIMYHPVVVLTSPQQGMEGVLKTAAIWASAFCFVCVCCDQTVFALDSVDPDQPVVSTRPYVYQNSGQGHEMSVSLQYELGYGSRESRNFTQEGVEQGLRARFQPLRFLGIEAFGGIVIDGASGEYSGAAGSIEVIGRALRQERHYINMDLGAGYIYDYRGDHVPRVRLTLGRSFDALDLSLSGLMEIPVGSAGRDEIDVMTSLALSYGLFDWYRLGIEFAVEDIEGFFDSQEAEGGAKLIFGPTMSFELPKDFYLKFNAAAVYAHTSNQTASSGSADPDTWGFMGRLIVGWVWR